MKKKVSMKWNKIFINSDWFHGIDFWGLAYDCPNLFDLASSGLICAMITVKSTIQKEAFEAAFEKQTWRKRN